MEKGQTVAVISPAGRIRTDCLERAVETMRRWGLDCRIGKHVMEQHGPCAGNDEARLQDLQEALDDPEVKAIIGTRGGYGSARMRKLKSLVSRKVLERLLLPVSRCSVSCLIRLRLVITLELCFVVFRELKSKEDRFWLNPVLLPATQSLPLRFTF